MKFAAGVSSCPLVPAMAWAVIGSALGFVVANAIGAAPTRITPSAPIPGDDADGRPGEPAHEPGGPPGAPGRPVESVRVMAAVATWARAVGGLRRVPGAARGLNGILRRRGAVGWLGGTSCGLRRARSGWLGEAPGDFGCAGRRGGVPGPFGRARGSTAMTADPATAALVSAAAASASEMSGTVAPDISEISVMWPVPTLPTSTGAVALLASAAPSIPAGTLAGAAAVDKAGAGARPR